jgi:hypothetical protein
MKILDLRKKWKLLLPRFRVDGAVEIGLLLKWKYCGEKKSVEKVAEDKQVLTFY